MAWEITQQSFKAFMIVLWQELSLLGQTLPIIAYYSRYEFKITCFGYLGQEWSTCWDLEALFENYQQCIWICICKTRWFFSRVYWYFDSQEICSLDSRVGRFLNAHQRVAYIAFGQNAIPSEQQISFILYGLLESIESGHIDGFGPSVMLVISFPTHSLPLQVQYGTCKICWLIFIFMHVWSNGHLKLLCSCVPLPLFSYLMVDPSLGWN